MERVGVRELRQNLSVYLHGVRRGETLEVTERGQPVAVLQPVVAVDDGIARLAMRGIPLRRGAGNLADLPPPATADLDRSLSEVLEDLREDSSDLRRLLCARKACRRGAGERPAAHAARARRGAARKCDRRD